MDYKLIRDPSGRAVSVVDELAPYKRLVWFVATAMLSALFIYFAFHPNQAGDNPRAHRGEWEFAAIFTFLSALILRQIVRHRGNPAVLADGEGVRFPLYSGFGIVPWQDIEGFSVQTPQTKTIGQPVKLVASLREPARYESKLWQESGVRPGKPSAPPFATIATSAGTGDMQELKALLDEVRHHLAF